VKLKAAAIAAMVLAAAALPAGARANTVTGSCTLSNLAPVNCAAWHSDVVTLRWSWAPFGETGTNGCDTRTFTRDTPASGTDVTCTVSWGGTFAGDTATVLVDRTPPAIGSATPARPPDHAGWYNHPVAFSFNGADPLSGIASCDSVTYSGPDGAAASVAGGCTDLAGNRGLAAFPLAYDGTPPAPARVTDAPGNGSIRLSWVLPADAARVRVVRLPAGGAAARRTIYQGTATHVTDRGLRNGVRYRYSVTVFDQAGNGAVTKKSAIPTASSLRPVKGTAVKGPPRLTWRSRRGASYYNVQLLKGGHKILSAWPHGPHLQLRHAWEFRGRRRHLIPGTYRWYVWPGYGSRADHRYGPQLGGSAFRVRR
jgi:hypothetical protein